MRTAKDYHLLWLAGMAAPRLTRKAVNREVRRLQANETKMIKTTMNSLDWGKTTAERNQNLDEFNSLTTEQEKEHFLIKLKRQNDEKSKQTKES